MYINWDPNVVHDNFEVSTLVCLELLGKLKEIVVDEGLMVVVDEGWMVVHEGLMMGFFWFLICAFLSW